MKKELLNKVQQYQILLAKIRLPKDAKIKINPQTALPPLMKKHSATRTTSSATIL